MIDYFSPGEKNSSAVKSGGRRNAQTSALEVPLHQSRFCHILVFSGDFVDEVGQNDVFQSESYIPRDHGSQIIVLFTDSGSPSL